jgi:uncharacterized protein
MPQMIFVNLPVTDLPRARAFYTGLGYTINEMFSDDTAACVVVSDSIFFMILTHAKFADFIDRPLGDPSKTVSVLCALTADSRADVDAFADRALAHGGRDNGKTQDYGFMYSRSLSDPDGNVLEILWMDPAAAAGGPPPV